MALTSKVVSDRLSTSIWRLPLSYLRAHDFSTSSGSAAAKASQNRTSGESKKPKRKKKNLIEVAQFLPNWGIGYHMAKTHWTNVSYEITKINLYKDGRHGKVWGLAYKDGVPAPASKKISGVHKRCWKYIPNPMKLKSEAEPMPETQAA